MRHRVVDQTKGTGRLRRRSRAYGRLLEERQLHTLIARQEVGNRAPYDPATDDSDSLAHVLSLRRQLKPLKQ